MATRKYIFFWRLTGEDPYILENCEKSIQQRFYYIGFFVFIILAISCISIGYGINEILQSFIFDLVIGVYIALFFLVLYMFNLYTLNKNVLPVVKSEKYTNIPSFLIRISFLLLLGFIVSQPLEYILFSKKVAPFVKEYKQELLVEFNNNLTKDYQSKFKDEISVHPRMSNQEKNEIIKNYNQEKRLKAKSYANYLKTRKFFIQKMILMDRNLWYIWPFSIIVMFIFILPVILKMFIPKYSTYYTIKRTIQKNIIDNNYDNFVKEYNHYFNKNFPTYNISYQTLYSNPPYNTRLKSKNKFKKESEFLKWLMNDHD